VHQTKAVLLARGLGRRMQAADDAPLTPSQQTAAAAGLKGMMPIGDAGTRPFLDHVLSTLADAGCRDVCLVVAPDHAAIRRYYEGDGRPSRINLSYAIQPLADGTARAVLAAEGFVGRDPFLALNADNVYPADVLRALANLDGPGLPAFERQSLIDESGFPADRVAAFALLDVDSGRLRRIIEKPGPDLLEQYGPRALVSMNAWRFDHRILDACRDVPLSARGEYELPEAVALALTRGIAFRAIPARGAVLDLSRRTDVADVTRRLAGREPRP
jgi:glucose-1-phosphate thymidylyltransferase